MELVIPSWVLNNIGGFVGFGILYLVLLRAQTRRKKRREQKRRDDEQEKRENLANWHASCVTRRDRELRLQQQTRKERDQELRDKELLLDSLLPGPWRTLYEFLHGYRKMTKQSVLLTAMTFKSDVDDIPKICPAGFDIILQVSYYTLNGKGSCHEEFTHLLGDYVEFPKNYRPI